MALLEYSVPGISCPSCTTPIDTCLTEARKNNQLNPAIRAVHFDLTDEPPRASVEVDANMIKPTCLHFLPPLPAGQKLGNLDMTPYKDSYIFIHPQLYYVSQSGSTEPVSLQDKDRLFTCSREEKEAPLPLSLEEEAQRITQNGGFTRLNLQAVQTEINFLTEPVGGAPFMPAESSKTQMYKHLFQGILGLLLGTVLMGLCLSGLPLSMTVLGILGAFSTLLTLYIGKDVYIQAYKKLKAKQFTMHTLFSVSTLMALGVSIASFFVPWLPMMFDTALLIFGFFHIGKAYEKYRKRELRQGTSYRSLAPTTILARGTGDRSFKEKFIYEIQPGELIRVPKGQIIGLNGIYAPELPDEKYGTQEEKSRASTKSAFINDPYSGSSLPQMIQPGDTILAGCIVPDSEDPIQLKVTASEENSYLVLLEERSKKSQAEKAPLETFAEKLLQYFVPTVFVLAIVSALIIGICLSPLTAIQVAATWLASVCPCTAGLIIPLIVKMAYTKAVTQGIEFANGQVLQTADEVDTVVFDLNGTLTTGQFRVISGHPATNLSPLLLDYLAAIEEQSGSTHGIATAIQHYIRRDLRRQPLPSLNAQTVKIEGTPHCGIVATIGGKTYAVGSKDFMLKKQFSPQGQLLKRAFTEEEILNKEILGHQAEQVVYLAENNEIQGCILLTDPLREEAQEVVNKLRKAGKDICICTGASFKTAAKYARMLGIPVDQDHIAGGCTPDLDIHSKTAFISYLKSGYNLRLLSTPEEDDDTRIERGKIYVKKLNDNTLEYAVLCTADNKVKRSFISTDQLHELSEPLKALTFGEAEVNKCQNFLTKILEITARKRHTQAPLKKKKIAMIGDGLNDSRAFQKCEFSIAIESRSSYSAVIESKASAVIRHKRNDSNKLSLRSILFAFSISKQAAQAIKRNLALSLTYNVLVAFAIGGLLVGLGFVINPAIGAALMFIQSGLMLASIGHFKHQKLTYANDPLLPKDFENSTNTTQQLQRSLHLPQAKTQSRDDIEISRSAVGHTTLQAPRVAKDDLEWVSQRRKRQQTWAPAFCALEVKYPPLEHKTLQESSLYNNPQALSFVKTPARPRVSTDCPSEEAFSILTL